MTSGEFVRGQEASAAGAATSGGAAPAGRAGPTSAFAAILLAAAVGSNLLAGGQYPGVDFWKVRIVPIVLGSAVLNPYDRDGRERLRQLAITIPATSARERLAATRNLAADERFLGYPGVETVASPLLFAITAPFSGASYETDHLAFRIVCLASFYAAVIGLCLLAGYSAAAAAFAAGALGLVFEPLLSELRVVKVNLLQLGAVAAFLALRRRPGRVFDVASGAVLALCVLLKPNALPIAAAVAIAWAAERRWAVLARVGAGALAGGALAVLVTTLILGPARLWLDWLTVLPDLVASPRRLAEGNYAPAGLLREALGVDPSLWLAVALLGAIGLVAGASRRAGAGDARSAFERTYLATGLGGAAMALSARLVWIHYFVLVLPLVLYLLRPGPARWGSPGRPWRGALATASALALTSGAKMLFLDSGLGGAASYAGAIAVGTAGLFALGASELLRAPSA